MTILPHIHNQLFPLQGTKVFNSPKEYFEYYIFEKNIKDLDAPLCAACKQWSIYKPDLDKLPNTKDYIKDEKSVSLNIVEQELLNTNQLFLPKDEILYHSGNLPGGITPAIHQTFKLKSIFSATLDPYIANVHDSEDNVYWCIQIKSKNIRCVPILDSDDEGEYEVIILGCPTAKIVDVVTRKRNRNYSGSPLPPGMSWKDYTIIYVELY